MEDPILPKFQNGDTVALKATGKELVVTHRSYESASHCALYVNKRFAGLRVVGCSREENGIIKEDIFCEDELELVNR